MSAPVQEKPPTGQRMAKAITESQIWRSVFRHGFSDTPRNRSLIVFSTLLFHLQPIKVRKSTLRATTTFWLGGIAMTLFALLTLTGILLMFYYIPSVERAYQDMKDLQFAVTYGPLLRNMHRWSAHGMVLFVFLHMMRVYYTGAYKPPREFNWVVGVACLLITLLLSFTGYLLPWDQLALWAVTVGSRMADYVPYLGPDIKFALLGGSLVGPNTLIRFYVLHCVLLPLVLAGLLGVHFWRIRKDGGLAEPAW